MIRLMPRSIRPLSTAQSGIACLICSAVTLAAAPAFDFPTGNTNLVIEGAEADSFSPTANPTVGEPWNSGVFGCVRTYGRQFHEGIDIKALEHDARGESTDAVRSAADGWVLYVNRKAGLSNYGNYVVVGHRIDGIDICTVYAHLREVREDLTPGLFVGRGEDIGVLGRTGSAISKDRAHLHFEVALFLNKKFPAWYAEKSPGARNDHGMWNGQNLAGIDAWAIFKLQAADPAGFNLVRFIRSQPEQCRIAIRNPDLPFALRHPALVEGNPTAQAGGVAGYEVVFSHTGAPIRLIPRAESELTGKGRHHLVSVNRAVYDEFACRRLVAPSGGGWRLSNTGARLVSLLDY